ncbi:MAG: AIPR family protein [Blastocatellia bacterium]|nr:AIPR family protein [Blastocatellia bacterium]
MGRTRRSADEVCHLFLLEPDGRLAPDEEARLKSTLAEFSTFSYRVETQATIAARLADKNRSKIDGKFKGIHKNLFELSGGNVRALIVHAEASQILRLLCDDAALRSDVSNTDLTALRARKLEESAFDDNVRIYLKQKPKVNQNIKATALSSENAKFFYFNNGLTMTCDRLDYPTNTSGPIITLENVQVVNGGQTLHALFEALTTDQNAISPIELLCRVYETKDRELSSRIAERTNSQSPVATRDIHSIDIEQITLEREFEALGLFYERKKAQYADKPADKRIDAEKCGQVYLAFYEEMPLEAKNRKGIIFGTKYDTIFSSTPNAEKLLLPFELFNEIEALRARNASGRRAWLAYASYHILFALKKVAEKKKVAFTYGNRAKISALLGKATTAVRKARETERGTLISADEEFADVLYFKQKKAVDQIAALI